MCYVIMQTTVEIFSDGSEIPGTLTLYFVLSIAYSITILIIGINMEYAMIKWNEYRQLYYVDNKSALSVKKATAGRFAFKMALEILRHSVVVEGKLEGLEPPNFPQRGADPLQKYMCVCDIINIS